MASTLRFYIDVPHEQLCDLKQALKDTGITGFSPNDNLVHTPPDNMQSGIFTGAQAPFAIREINRRLAKSDLPDRLPEDFRELPILAKAKILKIINVHTL